MISSRTGKTLRDYVTDLATKGRYCFALGEAREALGMSPNAARLAVNRMVNAGVLASPARGFYVAVPPEYRNLGKKLGHPCYILDDIATPIGWCGENTPQPVRSETEVTPQPSEDPTTVSSRFG